MLLCQQAHPFSHPDWLFEIKHDGFRALAVMENGTCELYSRNGNRFWRFNELARALRQDCQADNAILDGEIVCLDPKDGRSLFADLMFHRTEPSFYAFDVLTVEGQDLRDRPLIERKQWLKAIMPDIPSRLLYVDHIEEQGQMFYRLCAENDLEGMVAKRKNGTYHSERRRSSWIKIKNREYSQKEGRQELFAGEVLEYGTVR
jgi:bifunctional non-homologous end joining protein LigD